MYTLCSYFYFVCTVYFFCIRLPQFPLINQVFSSFSFMHFMQLNAVVLQIH